MDPRLIAVAQYGDVNGLRNLIAENPFLFKPAELTGGFNALHIACRAGHVDFVREVLYHDPGSAKELNADGVSQLHYASAYGYLDIVTELLVVGPHLCLVKAKNGKIPLHYAVAGGQIEVMKKLISACSMQSIVQLTDEGETCFHIALKYNDQVYALEELISHVKSVSTSQKRYILNKKDNQGNSILHLAASRKQYQALYLLLDSTLKRYLNLNGLNMKKLTMLDVLMSGEICLDTEKELKLRVEKKLKHAGAKLATEMSHRNILPRKLSIPDAIRTYRTLQGETRDTMLVVIILIAAATFQVAVSPPGGIWQDTVLHGSNTTAPPVPHLAGTSMLASVKPMLFHIFLYFNSTGFMASTFLLMILTASGDTAGGMFTMTLMVLWTTYILCTVMVTDHWFDSAVPVFISTGVIYFASGWVMAR